MPMIIGLHGTVNTKVGLPRASDLLASVPAKVSEYFDSITVVDDRPVKQWTHYYLMADNYYAFEQPVESAVGNIYALLSCDALNLDLAHLFPRMQEPQPEPPLPEMSEVEPEPPTPLGPEK